MYNFLLPSDTSKLLKYLRELPTDDPHKLLAAYTDSLPLLKADTSSLMIFLDYINILQSLSTDECSPEEIEHIFSSIKDKLRAYSLYWQSYIRFEVERREKSFDSAFNKMMDYFRVKNFIGKKEVEEIMVTDKENLRKLLDKNSNRMSPNKSSPSLNKSSSNFHHKYNQDYHHVYSSKGNNENLQNIISRENVENLQNLNYKNSLGLNVNNSRNNYENNKDKIFQDKYKEDNFKENNKLENKEIQPKPIPAEEDSLVGLNSDTISSFKNLKAILESSLENIDSLNFKDLSIDSDNINNFNNRNNCNDSDRICESKNSDRNNSDRNVTNTSNRNNDSIDRNGINTYESNNTSNRSEQLILSDPIESSIFEPLSENKFNTPNSKIKTINSKSKEPVNLNQQKTLKFASPKNGNGPYHNQSLIKLNAAVNKKIGNFKIDDNFNNYQTPSSSTNKGVEKNLQFTNDKQSRFDYESNKQIVAEYESNKQIILECENKNSSPKNINENSPIKNNIKNLLKNTEDCSYNIGSKNINNIKNSAKYANDCTSIPNNKSDSNNMINSAKYIDECTFIGNNNLNNLNNIKSSVKSMDNNSIIPNINNSNNVKNSAKCIDNINKSTLFELEITATDNTDRPKLKFSPAKKEPFNQYSKRKLNTTAIVADDSKKEKKLDVAFECELMDTTAKLKIQGNFIHFKGEEIPVIKKLGKGGHSSVYKVKIGKEEYALKKIIISDDDAYEKVISELKILKKVNGSEFVVKMIDFEIREDFANILFECGEYDLQRILKVNDKLDIFFVKYIWKSMLRILYFIHGNGIVHKDIKPGNFIFVEGKLKVIDFGISKTVRADTTSILNFDKEGTPNYISPEQVKGTKIRRSSDIWSAGCILYNMIYGKNIHELQNSFEIINIMTEERPIVYGPADPLAIECMKMCLVYDYTKRAKIEDLLNHKFLK